MCPLFGDSTLYSSQWWIQDFQKGGGGAHRCKISAHLRAKNFFTQLWPFLGKLSCTTVILISGHTKKGGGGGGMCLKCPLLDPPLVVDLDIQTCSLAHGLALNACLVHKQSLL